MFTKLSSTPQYVTTSEIKKPPFWTILSYKVPINKLLRSWYCVDFSLTRNYCAPRGANQKMWGTRCRCTHGVEYQQRIMQSTEWENNSKCVLTQKVDIFRPKNSSNVVCLKSKSSCVKQSGYLKNIHSKAAKYIASDRPRRCITALRPVVLSVANHTRKLDSSPPPVT